MRTVRLVGLMLLVGLLIGCASTFELNVYRTLSTAGTSYDAAMKTVSGLQAQGKVTAEQRKVVDQYANLFYGTYQTSVEAFATWKKTPTIQNREQLQIMLNGVASTWAVLAANINRIAPNTAVQTLEVR